MQKTLVVVRTTPDGHFEHFKQNVLDALNADLCICGSNPDATNPYVLHANFNFIYDSSDCKTNLEETCAVISENRPTYEKMENINALDGKLPQPKTSVPNVTYYGMMNEINDLDLYNENDILVHTKDFICEAWKNQLYGINNLECNMVPVENITTYKKPLPLDFLSNLKDSYDVLFFEWFLLKKLKEDNIVNIYDRFVITRGELNYQLPHPKIEQLDENCIWVPENGRHDTHVILSKRTLEPYLNLLENIILQSNKYLLYIKRAAFNVETLFGFHLKEMKVFHLVKEFPVIMYLDSDPFAYEKSCEYKKRFDSSIENPISIRKDFKVQSPIPLASLDPVIIHKFQEDFPCVDIHGFVNGVKMNSYDQIPDICKGYMNYKDNSWEIKWSVEMIDHMLECCACSEFDKLSPRDYPRSALQMVKVFTDFIDLQGKKCLVLGSISPWVECLLLHFKAESVTTLDYITPECSYKINMLSMDQYKKEMKYDVIVSFSSLEHDGLGRYGDPINPNGDIDACIEAYSMLKENGFFVCGIPIGEGCIQGNYHRIYNRKRVSKLFSLFDPVGSVNYQTLDETLNYTGADWQNQPIFIYKK